MSGNTPCFRLNKGSLNCTVVRHAATPGCVRVSPLHTNKLSFASNGWTPRVTRVSRHSGGRPWKHARQYLSCLTIHRAFEIISTARWLGMPQRLGASLVSPHNHTNKLSFPEPRVQPPCDSGLEHTAQQRVKSPLSWNLRRTKG